MTIEDMIWEQVEPTAFISKEEFMASLAGWHIHPVEMRGALGIAFLTKGPDLHFTTFPPVRPIPMSVVRKLVQPLIDAHGFARTRTPKDAARQRRFNELVGFVAEAEDEFFVTYRVEKLGRPACRL